jgi:hypothetical protein
MTEEGHAFARQTLKGRRGAPIRFTMSPPTKRMPTLKEHIVRIEQILAYHNLGTLFFTS